MKATITSIGDRKEYKQRHTRFTAYTDGKARDVADAEYFTKHGIGNLNFVCKSWGRVAGFAARMEASAVKEAIEQAYPGTKVEVKFSRKAGCACGCSPGFVGTLVEATSDAEAALSRSNVWLKDSLEDGDAKLIADYAAKQALGLPQEIAEGNAQVAAEKAAREEEQRKQAAYNAVRAEHWAAEERKWAEARQQEALDSACL